jgi:DNA-binding transcriptional ArsR family regulator
VNESHFPDEPSSPSRRRAGGDSADVAGQAGADQDAGACAMSSQRARSLCHADLAEVALHDVLNAVADPVRRTIIRELARCADWSRACGTFELGVSKATRSHHFTVLRQAGVLEQRDVGSRRLNRLRMPEFDKAFPGLIALILAEPQSQALPEPGGESRTRTARRAGGGDRAMT